MKNKQNVEQNQSKKKNDSLALSLIGYGIALLVGLIIAIFSWYFRRENQNSLTTNLSNFFIVPGVWMLVFSAFWWLSRKGYGNNIKFYVYKRRLKKEQKYTGQKIDKNNTPRSPFEYEKFHRENLNNVLLGLWLTIGNGALFFIIGLTFAFV